MRLLTLAVALTLAGSAFADTVRMKDGRVVSGTYLGGSARQVRMEVGDQIQTLDVSDIDRIEFGGFVVKPTPTTPPPPPPPPPAPMAEDRPVLRRGETRNENVMRPEPTPPPPPAPNYAGVAELPAGTNVVIRMIEAVDSETARQGQTFQASLDQPILLPNGQVVVDRGADVIVKLVDTKESGTFTGRAELALVLQSIRVNGRMVDVNTQSVNRQSNSQGGETAKRGAAGAIVGAGLGAIFGGGKGAATGATVGAAAGAGTQVITKGQRVRIPSETRLTFVLETPVRL